MLILIVFQYSCSKSINDKTQKNGFIEKNSINFKNELLIDNKNLHEREEPLGNIYLYGEEHGLKIIKDKEFEIWLDYYNNLGMRHLFIETPYYTAEYLNLWMKSDNDEIMDQLVEDWYANPFDNRVRRLFFENVKIHCPETIFHGTDIGHEYSSTGERYLDYLLANNMTNTDQYRIAKENKKQGERFYKDQSTTYREKAIVENFIQAYEALDGESIMGIYGARHANLNGMTKDYSAPSMGQQLVEIYGGLIYSEDLRYITKLTSAERIDVLNIDGKDYQASYYGKEFDTNIENIEYREIWRLENNNDDFKNKLTNYNFDYTDKYPIIIYHDDVLVVDLTYNDGSVQRKYLRSDNTDNYGDPIIEEFLLLELLKDNIAEENEIITIGGKEYQTTYYGEGNIVGFYNFEKMRYWILEDDYEMFKNYPATGGKLPYDFFPFDIKIGQVILVEEIMLDGSFRRVLSRADGNYFNNKISTDIILIE